ncbi:MAG: ribosomal protein S18-alanine N-acetyltransferase [Bacilli bacterium]|jgi:[ribosomal protein S18]-alanine N-acetyltransferase
MNIREATLDDLNVITSMEDLFLAPFSEEQVKYELVENPTSKILVMVNEENEVIGFIDFWITFDSATICQIAVKKEYQNQGVATMLLNKSFEILKKNDVLFYTLEVREHNESAYKLYVSLGFKKVVLKERYYSNGDNAIYMMKGLN